jgi:hypothetical protein
MKYLKRHSQKWSAELLPDMLNYAGCRLAAAELLRQQSAQWPDYVKVVQNSKGLPHWKRAILVRARAEGRTARIM